MSKADRNKIQGPFFQFAFKSRCLSLVIWLVTSDPAISTIWCFIKAFPNLLLILEEKCVPVTNPYGDTSLICPQSSKSKIRAEGKKEWPYILPDLLSLRPKVTKWSHSSFVGPTVFVVVVFNLLTFNYRNFTHKSKLLVSLENLEDLATFGCCLKWLNTGAVDIGEPLAASICIPSPTFRTGSRS